MKGIKYSQIKRIQELEKKLEAYCVRGGVTEAPGRFAIMLNDDSGDNILYVRDMNKKATGTAMDLYNNNPGDSVNKRMEIKWPYSGFIIGSILGWQPIHPKNIIKTLSRYGYTVEDFEYAFEQHLA